MNEMFERYINSVEFDGNFYFRPLSKLYKNITLDEFESLISWYRDPENSEEIESILNTNKVNIFKNLKDALELFNEERKSIMVKAPTKKSFEYIGLFDEH